METHNVTELVRVCDLTYREDAIREKNIRIHVSRFPNKQSWSFPDGDSPPPNIINQWIDLINDVFSDDDKPKATIATHCVAGLGRYCYVVIHRAPVLVAIALIERGMNPLDAILFLRQKRRGVINNRQMKWLESYKPRKKSSKCILC